MSNTDKFWQWLQKEQRDAFANYQDAMRHATIKDAAYWEGYGDAVINAEAACYGPTDLDGEDN